MDFNFNDGGRSKYFKAENVGDCVVRSVAIATGIDYKKIYDLFAKENLRLRGRKTARNGIDRKIYEKFLLENGFTWVPKMKIGQGCKTHLNENEVPRSGVLVLSLSRHLTCVIDGVINDTYDPSRGGTRCVYGYYIKEETPQLSDEERRIQEVKKINEAKQKEINEVLESIKAEVNKFTNESKYYTHDLPYILSELKDIDSFFN